MTNPEQSARRQDQKNEASDKKKESAVAIHSGLRSAPAEHAPAVTPLAFAINTLNAIGVVFGDIGTSVLYAFIVASSFMAGHLSGADVIGIISLIIWSLLLVVFGWYAMFLMNIHDHEEGGIPALLGRIREKKVAIPFAITACGIFGVALLYGDGAITPAISVISAVEGVRQIAPVPQSVVVIATVAILACLFMIQRWGTQKIGYVMGPVMVLWFVVIGVAGAFGISRDPRILEALSPTWAAWFLIHNPLLSVAEVLGAVVLSMTGGEAMYADRAHFGGGPIRAGWCFVVMPALILQYLGQGAATLHDPSVANHALLALFPQNPVSQSLIVLLSTFATIFASQALITGVFSLTKQLRGLKFLPFVEVVLPNRKHLGQVYLPDVNVKLAIPTLALVVIFQRSERLADAYGIAVLGTMLCTVVLTLYLVVWLERRIRALLLAVPVSGYLLLMFGANITKIPHGGWLPLTAGTGFGLFMIGYYYHHRSLAAASNADLLDVPVEPSKWAADQCYLDSIILLPIEEPSAEGIREQVAYAWDLGKPYIPLHVKTDASSLKVTAIGNRLRQIGQLPSQKPCSFDLSDPTCLKLIEYRENETPLVHVLESPSGEVTQPIIDFVRQLRPAVRGKIHVVLGQTNVERGGFLGRLHNGQGYQLLRRLTEIPGVYPTVAPHTVSLRPVSMPSRSDSEQTQSPVLVPTNRDQAI